MSAHDDVSAEKQRLRRDQRAARAALAPSTFIDAGHQVAQHLVRSSLWPTAVTTSTTIALFASRADELDVRPLERAARSAGCAVAVPRIHGDELVFHVVDGDIHGLPLDRFGIPTPSSSSPTIALSACALVVVPGVLFSVDGSRLGYGRGFYDRALLGVDLERVVGVLGDEQWWPRVPREPHDVRLHWLCSPAAGLLHTG
jgi:5-formyltetrahydrofolate cyclo-ligase